MKTLFLFLFCQKIIWAKEITQADIEAATGISVPTGRIRPDDWANKDPQISVQAVPSCQVPCRNASSGANPRYKNCCTVDNDCDPFQTCQSVNIFCHGQESLCECPLGNFPKKDLTGCIERPRKQLGQPCVEDVDLCEAAFGICVNGICTCKEDFVAINGICENKESECLFERPFMTNGVLFSCTMKANDCPQGYSCLHPNPNKKNILFLSSFGPEQSYCCPYLPDIPWPNKTDINAKNPINLFNLVCLHGKPPKVNPQHDCLPGYYMFSGIGRGFEVCCPEPCVPHPMATYQVINGKCVYESVNQPVRQPY